MQPRRRGGGLAAANSKGSAIERQGTGGKPSRATVSPAEGITRFSRETEDHKPADDLAIPLRPTPPVQQSRSMPPATRPTVMLPRIGDTSRVSALAQPGEPAQAIKGAIDAIGGSGKARRRFRRCCRRASRRRGLPALRSATNSPTDAEDDEPSSGPRHALRQASMRRNRGADAVSGQRPIWSA